MAAQSELTVSESDLSEQARLISDFLVSFSVYLQKRKFKRKRKRNRTEIRTRNDYCSLKGHSVSSVEPPRVQASRKRAPIATRMTSNAVQLSSQIETLERTNKQTNEREPERRKSFNRTTLNNINPGEGKQKRAIKLDSE